MPETDVESEMTTGDAWVPPVRRITGDILPSDAEDDSSMYLIFFLDEGGGGDGLRSITVALEALVALARELAAAAFDSAARRVFDEMLGFDEIISTELSPVLVSDISITGCARDVLAIVDEAIRFGRPRTGPRSTETRVSSVPGRGDGCALVEFRFWEVDADEEGGRDFGVLEDEARELWLEPCEGVKKSDIFRLFDICETRDERSVGESGSRSGEVEIQNPRAANAHPEIKFFPGIVSRSL